MIIFGHADERIAFGWIQERAYSGVLFGLMSAEQNAELIRS